MNHANGWILMDLTTGASVYFEKFSDCFPGLDNPLQVKVGDTYNKQPAATPEKGEATE